VEGMGSMVSLHADKTRGSLAFESYSAEAIFHYNFPPLAHPSSTSIIREAPTLYFGEGKPWHFEQTSAKGTASIFSIRSKVMRRLSSEPAKHAFMCA